MARTCACLLLGLSFGLASAAELTCTAKLIPPSTPKHALKFCHIFPDKSCCLPAQDNEIEEHYFNLLDAGDICAKESSMAKDALKQIFCAACSPLEPTYVHEFNGTTYFKMCSGLVDKVRPKAMKVGGKMVPASNPFDDCGMVRVEERGAPCQGDDVVVPSFQWDNEGSGCDTNTSSPTWRNCNSEYKFIQDASGAKPPFLDDYTMMIVDCDPATDDSCNTKCYTGAAAHLQAYLFSAYTLFALLSALAMFAM